MAGKKQAKPTSPGPNDRVYTVRWHRNRKCLTKDPETGWRWTEPESATLMTLAEAEAAVARMSGIICLDGIPVDKLHVTPPKKPPAVKGKPEGAPDAAGDVIRGHVAAERWREAVRLAMKFRGLGEDKTTIERAWDGFTRPDFCRQLKRDPEKLIAAGIEVLRRRWGS